MGQVADGLNARIKELVQKPQRTMREQNELNTLVNQFSSLGIPRTPEGDFDLASVDITERVCVRKFDGDIDETKQPVEEIVYQDGKKVEHRRSDG